MVVSVHKWLERAKFLFLFVLFTFLLYHALGAVSWFVMPREKYKEPEGHAIKAFGWAEDSPADVTSMADRLRLFWWYGE